MSLRSAHLRAWRSKVSGGIPSAAAIRLSSDSTASGPTLSVAFANALAWVGPMSPVENRSHTSGIPDSCLAIFAILWDSRPGNRAPCLSTSAGSVSGSESPTRRPTSHIKNAATDCTRPNNPSVSFASVRDIGPKQTSFNSASAALIRSAAPLADPSQAGSAVLPAPVLSPKRANACSLSMI